MFKKIEFTVHPPSKPELIWDGECGFCKFWKTRWELKTGDRVNYRTFQERAEYYPDIPLKEFKKASRLIETDGSVYSGPDSAYRTLQYSGNSFWHNLYKKQSWFTWLSDHGYNHIAKNRAIYFKVTKRLFGENPEKLSYDWLFYMISIFILITMLSLSL